MSSRSPSSLTQKHLTESATTTPDSADSTQTSQSYTQLPRANIVDSSAFELVEETSPDFPNNILSRLPDGVLSPIRAHYLKKSLVELQFQQELHFLTNPSPSANTNNLSYLGSPFSPPPKGVNSVDLPFLKYVFRQFVLTFPFLTSAPKDFFPEKLQPFITSVLSRNLSSTSVIDDDAEVTEEVTRRKLLSKLQKYFALLLGSSTKLVEKEEVVRLTQKDLTRLENLARRRKARLVRSEGIFDVNIVCVRIVADKRRVRSRAHEEFIIRTRRSDQPDVFVSRRYGDFKTLADELRKMYPDEIVRPPPAKDRTVVAATSSVFNSSISPPNDSFESLPSPSMQTFQSFRLAREKNRLTLRAYLHSLLGSSVLASSPVLRSFLLSGPTQLIGEEIEDAKRREEADQTRENNRRRFALEIASRVEGLRVAMQRVKSDIMLKDGGLSTVFSTIRATEIIHDLPSEYQAVLEWGRISLASTIYHHFVAEDDASENLASLKRIHGLVPYFVLKGILKISNPVAMIRGVMDLFLAQPFGGRSLLQRMFTSSLQEETKVLEEHIRAVKDKVQDPLLCEKVKQFVYAPREFQSIYKADAAAEKLHILAIILRSGDEPTLSPLQMQKVLRAHRAHADYIRHKESLTDSDDDEGPEDEEAWLFEDLTILARLYSRLRDKEQLIALIFEGTTADLLKDIITIFYAPLAQVYKAASIADSLGDFQDFLNDLIRTVEQIGDPGYDEPQRTVKKFIDLVQRHEQAFYSFVHKVHSKGQSLFDGLMRWIELFLTATRDGFADKISLEYLLPHTGKEREDIFREVDEVALYHYRLKLAYEDKIRRRFGKSQSKNQADTEDDATQRLVEGVALDFNFGDLVEGDANEIAAEESDESEDSSSESDPDDESSSNESGHSRHFQATAISNQTIDSSRVIRRSDNVVATSSTIDRTSHDPKWDSQDLQRIENSSISDNKAKSNNDIPAYQSKPLPSRPSSSQMSLESLKPLPARPGKSASAPTHRIPDNHAGQEVIPVAIKKRKRDNIMKPPNLEHIPKLLPLFVEVMRPLLVPRKV